MNERQECPMCHKPMDFVWPSPSDDPEVAAVLGRLQECRNQWCVQKHGKYQIDVQTGERHTFMREKGKLYIDGKPYKHINEWVRATLLSEAQS